MGQLLENLSAEERVTIVERAFRSYVGRRRMPKFWTDEQMRRFLIVEHPVSTLDQARQALVALVGDDKAPSRSAIQRFWHSLDQFWRAQR